MGELKWSGGQKDGQGSASRTPVCAVASVVNMSFRTFIVACRTGTSSSSAGPRRFGCPSNPRSPGTHTVGPWVTDSINLYRGLKTGTQYVGKLFQPVLSRSSYCWHPGGHHHTGAKALLTTPPQNWPFGLARNEGMDPNSSSYRPQLGV